MCAVDTADVKCNDKCVCGDSRSIPPMSHATTTRHFLKGTSRTLRRISPLLRESATVVRLFSRLAETFLWRVVPSC